VHRSIHLQVLSEQLQQSRARGDEAAAENEMLQRTLEELLGALKKVA
jgi:hypothetical protein